MFLRFKDMLSELATLSDREGIPKATDLPEREGSRYVWRDRRSSGRVLIESWNPGGKKISTKEKRWYKDVGLGFKTPSEAIQGTYIGTF